MKIEYIILILLLAIVLLVVTNNKQENAVAFCKKIGTQLYPYGNKKPNPDKCCTKNMDSNNKCSCIPSRKTIHGLEDENGKALDKTACCSGKADASSNCL